MHAKKVVFSCIAFLVGCDTVSTPITQNNQELKGLTPIVIDTWSPEQPVGTVLLYNGTPPTTQTLLNTDGAPYFEQSPNSPNPITAQDLAELRDSWNKSGLSQHK